MSSDRSGRGRRTGGKTGRRPRRSARRRLMIYGSTGFTGRLIAERAVEIGLAPVLAGRDEDPRAASRRSSSGRHGEP